MYIYIRHTLNAWVQFLLSCPQTTSHVVLVRPGTNWRVKKIMREPKWIRSIPSVIVLESDALLTSWNSSDDLALSPAPRPYMLNMVTVDNSICTRDTLRMRIPGYIGVWFIHYLQVRFSRKEMLGLVIFLTLFQFYALFASGVCSLTVQFLL